MFSTTTSPNDIKLKWTFALWYKNRAFLLNFYLNDKLTHIHQKYILCETMDVISGGSRISQKGGGRQPPSLRYMARCLLKTAWKWRKLNREVGGRSQRPLYPPIIIGQFVTCSKQNITIIRIVVEKKTETCNQTLNNKSWFAFIVNHIRVYSHPDFLVPNTIPSYLAEWW